MKSPPNLSVGFTYLYLFDSIFKEYSDPHCLRNDVAKLCGLFSGGISAMVIAPLLKNILLSCVGALPPPTLGYAQAEYLS